MTTKSLQVLVKAKNLSAKEIYKAQQHYERLQKRVKILNKRMEDSSKKATKTFEQTWSSSLRKVGTGLTVVGGAITAASSAMINFAIEAQESENLFKESMGSMEKVARDWSNELAAALGLNEFNLRKQVGIFNVMLNSMGLVKESSFAMAQGLTQLGYDIASFYNITVEEAMNKLSSALVGMPRPLQELGIIVKEETVKIWAYKNGLAAVGEELTEQQKIYGRYMVIMEQTGKAQTDLARTQTSLQNLLRRTKESLISISVVLGSTLIPSLSTLMLGLNAVFTHLKGWVTMFPNLSAAIMTAATVLGALALVLGPIAIVLPSLVALFAKLGTTLGMVSLYVAGITAAFIALYVVMKNFGVVAAFVQSVAAGINSVLIKIVDHISMMIAAFAKLPGVGRLVEGVQKQLKNLTATLKENEASWTNKATASLVKQKKSATALSETVKKTTAAMKKSYADLNKVIQNGMAATKDSVEVTNKEMVANLKAEWETYQKSLPKTQLKNLDKMRDQFMKHGYDKVEIDEWYESKKASIVDNGLRHMEKKLSVSAKNMKKTMDEILFDGIKNGFDNLDSIIEQFTDNALRQMISSITSPMYTSGGGGGSSSSGGILEGIGAIGSLFGGGGSSSSGGGSSSSGGGGGSSSSGGGLFGGFFHNGGVVKAHNGLAPDEIPIVAQTGERVLSRKENKKYEAMMSEGGRESTEVHYYIQAIDPISFAGFIRRNPEAIHEVINTNIKRNRDIRRTIKRYT